MAEFARGLGYRFRDLGRLEEALTHGSYRNDYEVADYERLEFLGDAALGLVVTETIHYQRPDWPGQRRQETKSDLVSNQSLAGAARELALEDGIRVGKGRAAGEAVRSSDRILANVFEAVLGAAYLDGGIAAARGIFATAFRYRLRRLRLEPPRASRRRSLRALLLQPVRLLRLLLFLKSRKERALRYTFGRPSLVSDALDREAEAGSPRRRRARYGRRDGRRGRRGGRRRGGRGSGRAASGNSTRSALRFLGRDVIHLVAADALQDNFPDWDEGRLTLARMRMQERDFTAQLSQHWALGEGDVAAADAEALLGALYLDGGLAAARQALRRPFREIFVEFRDPDLELLDPKTLLQNRLAKEGREAPQYEVHQPERGSRSGRIEVTIRLGGGISETGRGRGVKDAEKDAARRAIARLDKAEAAARRRPARQSERAPVHPSNGRPAELASSETSPSDNPKGALQEALVKQEGRLPVYRVISESGPEHDKTWVVEVMVGRKPLGRGSGRNKRTAEAEAAAAALATGVAS